MATPEPSPGLKQQRRRQSAYPTARRSVWRRYRKRFLLGFALCCLIAMVTVRPAWAAFRRIKAQLEKLSPAQVMRQA